MSILVACSKCQKKYKVDDKFAGKKAKCKACGTAFSVPAEPKAAASKAAAPEDDLMAGLQEAAASEHRATGAPATNFATRSEAQPARPAARPSAGPPARPAAQPPSRPAPRTPVESAPDDGLDLAEPRRADACPGCGAALAPAAALCVACDYSRATGRSLNTQVSRDSIPTTRTSGGTPRNASGEERDHAGVRANVGYTHPMLDFFDGFMPSAAFLLFAGIILVFLGLPHYASYRAFGAPSGGMITALIKMNLMQILGCILTMGVIFPLTLLGVRLAGRIMKFESPEKPFSRLLAVHLTSALPMLISLGLVYLGASHDNQSARTLAALGAIFLLISVVLYFLLSYPTFLFFFRLKFLESLVAFPMMIGFFIVGSAAAALVLYLVGLIIKAVWT